MRLSDYFFLGLNLALYAFAALSAKSQPINLQK